MDIIYQKHKSSGWGFLFLLKVRIMHESSVSVLETAYLHITEESSFFPHCFLQLTCMLNLLSGEISQNFTDYPSDMLLYLRWFGVSKHFLALTLKCITNVKNNYWFYLSFFSKNSSKNVNKGNCRSYFSALGAADFSVASKILNKGSQLFREATVCLVSDVFFYMYMSKGNKCMNYTLTLIRLHACTVF